MKVLAYQGRGWVSKSIQWQTRSPWSHVGILLDNNRVVEAWHRGGVCLHDHIGSVHSPGTKVSVFSIEQEFNEAQVEDWLLEQIGKDYDFRSVARFVSRRTAPANDRWFCSELVHAALPFLLERIKSARVSPRDIVMSPLLKLEQVRTT